MMRDTFRDRSLRESRRVWFPRSRYLECPERSNFVGTTAALIMGGLAAAGAVGSAAVSSHAASSAADKTSAAADQIRQQALDAAKTASGTVNDATTQANQDIQSGADTGHAAVQAARDTQLAALQPYIDAGQLSLTDAQKILSENGPLGAGSQFSFGPQDYQNDPGYEFIRQQSQQALDRSAAARGASFTGGTIRATDRLQSGLAATHLDDAFNRALATYTTNRQNVLSRLQGLTHLYDTGYSATGVANQDIGNTAQTENADAINSSRQIAANKIAAGEFSGNAGLKAAAIGADALSSKAGAQAGADIATGTAINSGIGGVVNAAQNVIYSLPRATGMTIPFDNTVATHP
jgi:hypothetical protein